MSSRWKSLSFLGQAGETSESLQQQLNAANKGMLEGFKEYHAHISKFSKELDKVGLIHRLDESMLNSPYSCDC